jgi:hypothetical protein
MPLENYRKKRSFCDTPEYRLCPLRERDSQSHACPDGQRRTLTNNRPNNEEDHTAFH